VRRSFVNWDGIAILVTIRQRIWLSDFYVPELYGVGELPSDGGGYLAGEI
jgi:hypothetical protein